jgi:cell division protein FtsW (lipid II flippase)
MRTTYICVGLVGAFCLGRFSSGWILPAAIAVALALIWATLDAFAESVDDPRWGRFEHPWIEPAADEAARQKQAMQRRF